MTLYDWNMLIGGLFLLNMFISWLVFARCTVHPLEKRIQEEGGWLPNWDSIGFRVPGYAIAFILPNKVMPLVDEETFFKLTTNKDKYRAYYFFISFCGTLVMALLAYLCGFIE